MEIDERQSDDIAATGGEATSPVRRALRAVRMHLFVTAVVACALLGAALRFVPSSAAQPAGSNGSGASASTACAAK